LEVAHALVHPLGRSLDPDRLWPVRVAARKGHSFFLFFLFSPVFFPLALLVAYMVSDRRVPAATY
jgi:hypothetical protein